MDIVTRQKLIVLIQLAKADEEFAPSEKKLIEEIAQKHNFPDSDLKTLFESTESFESLGPLSTEKTKEYLIDSLRLIMADGKIEPREITFCQNLAVKLGYHKDVVSDALDKWDTVASLDFSKFKLM